ncbi:hypothetical protein BKA58DRAFT_392383 [Alternaria rosae]|uniref:uncharacterized protein n=1 Tax=Alternaria rosae TaxID=1187941 RepID=UPI001E8D0392|nr:uncharacterized protein BKA58DRAFT_392383 [Alternaria rosae]KAH6860905.1 hypothetical protein BKA58DRAFT_392383 [Alternaria rosae]
MVSLQNITGRVPSLLLTTLSSKASCRQILPSIPDGRYYSDASSKTSNPVKDEAQKVGGKTSDDQKPKKKTQAELDAELMAKMAGLDGEGGEAGIEYEDGKPASMKRSVKNNMFRYI